jgi:hypothetical protein
MDLALPPVSLQRRVQFAILLQLAEHGTAGRATTAAICPSTGPRDFAVALENLLDEGSIEGPPWRIDSLASLAQGGWLTLTARGRLRLDEDDV